MRTIGVITTSRADYGIYLPVLKAIESEQKLRLFLYVVGGHVPVSVDFAVAGRIKVRSGDAPEHIASTMGHITAAMGQLLKRRRPDLMIALGDRFDMHAAALAAVPFNIPLAHIHGGEITQGAFDEYFRHSLTKFSHLHFASTQEYARRIVQLGEDPTRVIISGAPALDNLKRMPLLSKGELSRRFALDFSKPVLLVTFHPVTLEYRNTKEYIKQLLQSLEQFSAYNIVLTAPNTDTSAGVIKTAIAHFVDRHANARYIPTFGIQGYWSLMRHAKAMVGNSSSGVIEAASFKLPVVNIGTRQQGRIKPGNVIDCEYGAKSITTALNKALSSSFRVSLKGLNNPYGQGQAARLIVKTLLGVDLAKLCMKKFRDLKVKS